MLANDNLFHMILVIIINVKGQVMLNRALGSGWGVLLPGAILGGLLGGAAGSVAGAKFGDVVDGKVLGNFQCGDCGHEFSDR